MNKEVEPNQLRTNNIGEWTRWLEANHDKKKVEWLTREGRMKPSGIRTVEVARENGMWDKGIKIPEVDDSLPGALLNAFQSNPKARDSYFEMSPASQKQYNIWINMAKRAGTIQRRLEESIRLLERCHDSKGVLSGGVDRKLKIDSGLWIKRGFC
jgi:hypothetical protein